MKHVCLRRWVFPSLRGVNCTWWGGVGWGVWDVNPDFVFNFLNYKGLFQLKQFYFQMEKKFKNNLFPPKSINFHLFQTWFHIMYSSCQTSPTTRILVTKRPLHALTFGPSILTSFPLARKLSSHWWTSSCTEMTEVWVSRGGRNATRLSINSRRMVRIGIIRSSCSKAKKTYTSYTISHLTQHLKLRSMP